MSLLSLVLCPPLALLDSHSRFDLADLAHLGLDDGSAEIARTALATCQLLDHHSDLLRHLDRVLQRPRLAASSKVRQYGVVTAPPRVALERANRLAHNAASQASSRVLFSLHVYTPTPAFALSRVPSPAAGHHF